MAKIASHASNLRAGRGWCLAAVAWACAAGLGGCQREDRNLAAPAEAAPQAVALSDLRPGPSGPPPTDDPRGAMYDGNATHIANGQRYFRQFNCNGCHFNGGGSAGMSFNPATPGFPRAPGRSGGRGRWHPR